MDMDTTNTSKETDDTGRYGRPEIKLNSDLVTQPWEVPEPE